MNLLVLTRRSSEVTMKKRLARLLLNVRFSGLAFFLLAASIAIGGCGHKAPAPKDSLPVTVQAVALAKGVAGGGYSANIIADTLVDVAFKVNGYVQSILQVKGADGMPRNVQA